MNIRGTDFVMFLVSDLSRATAFFRDALGLPEAIRSEEFEWTEFDCGNVTLALRGNSLSPGETGGGRIALAVPDIDEAWAELAGYGLVSGNAIRDDGCCRSFEVRDPDGNVVIIHQRTDGTWG